MEMTPLNTKIVRTKSRISWLDDAHESDDLPDFNTSSFTMIEKLAYKTNRRGRFPLWEGYLNLQRSPDATERQRAPWRTSNDVRTTPSVGAFFSWLVQRKRPMTIVEFGTAFGVSGMYWLHGLERIGQGLLYTFEPNRQWRALAVDNLRQVGDRFVSIAGTFEDEISRLPLPANGIDIAFVDAIHTSDFVYQQVDILKRLMPLGGVIVLDDINFSDDMRSCWTDLSQRDDVRASAEGYGRIGIIEYASTRKH